MSGWGGGRRVRVVVGWKAMGLPLLLQLGRYWGRAAVCKCAGGRRLVPQGEGNQEGAVLP